MNVLLVVLPTSLAQQQLPSLLVDAVQRPRSPEEVPLSIRFFIYRSYLYFDYIYKTLQITENMYKGILKIN